MGGSGALNLNMVCSLPGDFTTVTIPPHSPDGALRMLRSQAGSQSHVTRPPQHPPMGGPGIVYFSRSSGKKNANNKGRSDSSHGRVGGLLHSPHMTPSAPRDQSERPLLMFASRYYDWNTLYPIQSFTSAHCRFRNTLLAILKLFPQTKSNQNVTTVWGECFDWSSARDFYAHCCFRAPATHSHYFFRGGNHSWKLCTHE